MSLPLLGAGSGGGGSAIAGLLYTGSSQADATAFKNGVVIGGSASLVQSGPYVYDSGGGGGITSVDVSSVGGLGGVVHADYLTSALFSNLNISGNAITSVTGCNKISLSNNTFGGGEYNFSNNAISTANCSQIAKDFSNNAGIAFGGDVNLSGQTPYAGLSSWTLGGVQAIQTLQYFGWPDSVVWSVEFDFSPQDLTPLLYIDAVNNAFQNANLTSPCTTNGQLCKSVNGHVYGCTIDAAIAPSTTIAASITSGTRTVTPGSMTGILVGSLLKIDASGTPESVTVTTITSTTFTAVFASNHNAGSTCSLAYATPVIYNTNGLDFWTDGLKNTNPDVIGSGYLNLTSSIVVNTVAHPEFTVWAIYTRPSGIEYVPFLGNADPLANCMCIYDGGNDFDSDEPMVDDNFNYWGTSSNPGTSPPVGYPNILYRVDWDGSNMKYIYTGTGNGAGQAPDAVQTCLFHNDMPPSVGPLTTFTFNTFGGVPDDQLQFATNTNLLRIVTAFRLLTAVQKAAMETWFMANYSVGYIQ